VLLHLQLPLSLDGDGLHLFRRPGGLKRNSKLPGRQGIVPLYYASVLGRSCQRERGGSRSDADGTVFGEEGGQSDVCENGMFSQGITYGTEGRGGGKWGGREREHTSWMKVVGRWDKGDSAAA